MGDTHFLIRHALTGGVFMLFVALGWWCGWPTDFVRYFEHAKLGDLTNLVTALVSSAIIGITIQGMHMLALDAFQMKFSDRARHIVANHVKPVFRADYEQQTRKLNEDSSLDDSLKQDEIQTIRTDQALLEKVGADEIFVWLYHRLAPNDLIEWARRRRSYSYLGINWAIAATIGFLAGLAAPLANGATHQSKVTLVVLGGLVWCSGAIVAAIRLRREVDRMEFIWAAARVRPELRKDLNDHLSPQDETRLGGSLSVQLDPRPAPAARSEPPGVSS